MSSHMLKLDPEEKRKRIDRLMDCTKEEIATQWVTLVSEMKQKYENLNMEFMSIK
jgi:hypothetical protein